MTLNRNGTNKTLITDKKTDLTNAETMNSEARKAKDVNKQRSCVGDESNKKTAMLDFKDTRRPRALVNYEYGVSVVLVSILVLLLILINKESTGKDFMVLTVSMQLILSIILFLLVYFLNTSHCIMIEDLFKANHFNDVLVIIVKLILYWYYAKQFYKKITRPVLWK